MKVIHVISGLSAGGAEHLVLELCRYSKCRSDVDMAVLSLSAVTQIENRFLQLHIPLIRINCSSSRQSKVFTAIRALLKEKPEIIHAHMFHACVIACVMKVFYNKTKIVFTLHNNYVKQWHRKWLLFITRWLRSADIIFPGLPRKWYQKKNVVCIANGVDVKQFIHAHTVKPPIFTCAFIGRLSEEKNPLFLIDLAQQLSKEHNFLIRVAGEGRLKNDLICAIEKNNLQLHFHIEGYVEDVPALLAQSHCLLLPSVWEGMPLAVLEAGAAGIPVIATPVGNIPSLLNTSNGFVTELSGFRQAVNEVINNYGSALVVARNFMHTVHEQYSMSTCYQRHVEVYLQK